MTALDVALAGLGLTFVTALLAPLSAPRTTAALALLAGLTLVGAGLAVLAGAPTAIASLPFAAPGAPPALRLDPLAALFLVPIGLMGALGPLYGTAYWPPSQRSERLVRTGYVTLVAALALIVLAWNGTVFLFAWEIMALAGFFLVAAEHQLADTRAAAFVYLVASHISILALWWLFSRFEAATGAFAFGPLPATAATTFTALLALFAFGIKAGFIPLHVWLPGAHAAAPSHVSAVLSGVVLKVGIYGIVRTITLAPSLPSGVGALVLILGVVSAVLGVVHALGQHDLKRLLAYHSIENIGIILIGLGLAMLGRSTGHPVWVALGLGGALLHVWNHALFKSLLFLGAGAVIHAVHTRVIDRLGGLARRQPRTAFTFLIGAIAISGLPPLNGFVSELLIYLGLFDAARSEGSTAVAMAAPALAIVGALALACFVKVYGAVFLGEPRTAATAAAHDPSPAMLAPMYVLAALCALIGLAPWLVAPALDRVIADLDPAAAAVVPALAQRASLVLISVLGVALLLVIALAWRLGRAKRRAAPPAGTWDCGYAAPTPRIQYTASSFAALLTGMFRPTLRPEVHPPHIDRPLPAPTRYEEHPRDPVFDGLVLPAFARLARALARVRPLQSGSLQIYLLYIFLAVLALLASTVPFEQLLETLWSP